MTNFVSKSGGQFTGQIYDRDGNEITGGASSTTFLGLTDTPGTFTADEWVKVNAAGTALEFVTAPSSDHGSLSGLGDDDHTQYHTDARALTWLGTRSTTDVSEGTNLYFTDERVDDRVNALISATAPITSTYDDGVNTLTLALTQSGIDHGSISGLSDDDHSQYHNDTRGDVRYLYKENTSAFTPDADYEPATKKYVDDNVVSPAGSDTEIQYNDSGSFGANSGLTFEDTTKTLTVGTVASNSYVLQQSGVFSAQLSMSRPNGFGSTNVAFITTAVQDWGFGVGAGKTYFSIDEDNTTTKTRFRVEPGATVTNPDLYLHSDQNVGLLTTSPAAQLHVLNDTTTDPTVIFENVASQTANSMEIRDSSSTVLASFDETGALTCGGNTSGQSTLGLGLVVNYDQDNTANADFVARTALNASALRVDASAEEIQTNVILKAASGVNTIVSTNNTANPPTDAELDTAFGTPASLGEGFIGILDDNSDDTNVYLCATSDSSWYYLALTKAV